MNPDGKEERQINPPGGLRELQEGFGQAIRTPFSFATGKFAFQKERYPEAMASAIRPRPPQSGLDRLSVYNEQYWFRLLTILQTDFPLLAAALGLWEFNQLATDYLGQYPSRRPFLDYVPDPMPAYMLAHPKYGGLQWQQITAIDMAFLKAFSEPSLPALSPGALSAEEMGALENRSLKFQPFVTLIEEDWDLMAKRASLDEDANESLPSITFEETKGYWVIYRQNDVVEWQSIHPLHFRLLKNLQAGFPLGEACERTATDLSEADQAVLASGIGEWFSFWSQRQCFQKP